ncbi:MAG: hypothetical protein ABMA25_15515 [Ilumatobacteraceae bacterium]
MDAKEEPVRTVQQVFVPGGQPTFSYYDRRSLRLEQMIDDYLKSSGRVLSLTGSTKCGKTVAIRRVLGSQAILLAGGNIKTVEDFWTQLAYRADAFSGEEIRLDDVEKLAGGGHIGVNFGVADAQLSGSSEGSVSRGRSQTREIPLALATTDKLIATKRPLVIDDFHYIPRSAQRDVLRAIRPIIFESVPVILISVPHRGEDAVRAEPELNGRVQQLHVPLWSPDELAAIAVAGYQALNLAPSKDLLEVLAGQASGSPHLMQEFCLQAALREGFRTREPVLKPFDVENREEFFQHCALQTFSRVDMRKFLTGPQQRGARKPRTLRHSPEPPVDIYFATILALCTFGPREKITYNELRAAFRLVLIDADMPQKHEITRVLGKMHDIALAGDGEPVLEWDPDQEILHITDPFFAFLLRSLSGSGRPVD